MRKLIALVAFGLGYLLGTRDGRERYDQIMKGFTRVREDPRVQQQVHQVADVAKEQSPVVMDKLGDVASSAARKVRPSHSNTPATGEGPDLTEESTLGPEDQFPTSVA